MHEITGITKRGQWISGPGILTGDQRLSARKYYFEKKQFFIAKPIFFIILVEEGQKKLQEELTLMFLHLLRMYVQMIACFFQETLQIYRENYYISH